MAEDLLVDRIDGLALATIVARRDAGAEAIGSALGGRLADGPACTLLGELRLVGTAPGTWLAMVGQRSPDWEDRLRARLAGLACLSDQSGGYVLFRLGGSAARAVLQRGLALDLDPRRFRPGMAATSAIDHIGVTLWQEDDRPSYAVALSRSYAASFLHWLDDARDDPAD